MKIAKTFFSVFLLAPLWAFGAGQLSLDKLTGKIQKSSEIADLYKNSGSLKEDPTPKLKPLFKSNQKTLQKLEKEFSQSSSFIRGEIENEKVLSNLMTLLQLSLLNVRSHSFHGNWSQVEKEFSNWFLFAADFPYEESSLVGLRTAGVIRSLLLDDLERIQLKFSKEIAADSAIRKWFLQVRAPWPVDRVMISEAKRLLKPPLMQVATAAAKAYQKNPYQPTREALKRVKGGESREADVLKEMWRETDIQLMKTEMNRIGKLKIHLAKAEYEHQNKKSPKTVQDLLNAGLLETAPIDYFSGKPLDLTSQ